MILEVRSSRGMAVATMAVGAVPAILFGGLWVWLATRPGSVAALPQSILLVLSGIGVLLVVTGWRLGTSRLELLHDRIVHRPIVGARRTIHVADIAWVRHVPNRLGIAPRSGKRFIIDITPFPNRSIHAILAHLHDQGVRVEEGGMGDWPYGSQGYGGGTGSTAMRR